MKLDNTDLTVGERIILTKQWWWLSFCDPNKLEGSQFLGVVIVRGFDFGNAVVNAHILKCNPGGEVRGINIPDDIKIPEKFQNRILSREDVCEFDKFVGGPGEASTWF